MKWKSKEPSSTLIRRTELLHKIKKIFIESKEAYGSPRVHAKLKREGIICSKHLVAKLMSSEGLIARRAKRRVVTTDSHHGHSVARQEYKVHDRSTHPQAPYEVWAGDITYLSLISKKFVYLSVVMDLFDRRIIGWQLGDTLDVGCVIKALSMAFFHEGHPKRLIFHSDRGVQYTSLAMKELLQAYQCQASMSRKGNCYDNAYVESFFKTLKIEMFSKAIYETKEALNSALFSYIAWYNRERLHSSLYYLSPQEYYQRWFNGDLERSH